MAKLVLNDVANLQSETTALQVLNDNFARIAAAFENTFSRDGSSPNFLSASLDVNSNRVLNLPVPVTNSEPLRLGDIGGLLPSNIATAGASAASAAASAAAAAASATAAAGFVGSATQAPKWTTGRTISVFGDVNGTSPAWDGSGNLSFTGITIVNGAVTGPKMATGASVSNLGYTPLNKAGDTLTGDVQVSFVASTLVANSVGFRGVPINEKDVTYTLAVDDVGKLVRHNSGSAHTYWIDTNGVTPYPIGAAIALRNVGAGAITIGRGPGVALRKAGSSTDADVTLAQWGMATIIQETSNVWIVSGIGIT